MLSFSLVNAWLKQLVAYLSYVLLLGYIDQERGHHCNAAASQYDKVPRRTVCICRADANRRRALGKADEKGSTSRSGKAALGTTAPGHKARQVVTESNDCRQGGLKNAARVLVTGRYRRFDAMDALQLVVVA